MFLLKRFNPCRLCQARRGRGRRKIADDLCAWCDHRCELTRRQVLSPGGPRACDIDPEVMRVLFPYSAGLARRAVRAGLN